MLFSEKLYSFSANQLSLAVDNLGPSMLKDQITHHLCVYGFLQLMRTGWTVWTTRGDHTSRSSLTLPVGGNELSVITVTPSQLVISETRSFWTDPE